MSGRGFVSNLLHNASVIVSALSQTQTNGGCSLGTNYAPKLPSFLSNNPIVNGYPWGTLSAQSSDPEQPPNTGAIRTYDFTLSRGTIAPDGYEKSALLVNGQFPGPTIEANWGDTIQVTVHNEIASPAEGTSIHWHGLLQQGIPWQDGVPAVSQCPIAPGDSLTYSFRATLYGTTWYHSHFSSQLVGGLWGPLIVYGPKNTPYDIDLGPISLSDYYHRDYYTVVQDVMGTDLTKIRPASDNNLINGKMNFDCSNTNGTVQVNGTTCTNNAGLATFNFQSGKKHRLRLINPSSQAIEKFSIDGHTLTIIANDLTPVVPYNVSVVTLAIGQRTDVIVTGTGNSSGAYWMRATISGGQCTEPANQPYALATVYYENANTSSVPQTIGGDDPTDPCSGDPLTDTVPYYSQGINTPTTTTTIAVDFLINSTNHLVWTLNNSTFRGDYNNPILLLSKTGNNTAYPPTANVYNFGNQSTIRIVLNNLTPTSHPWHMHGHTMSVLAQGTGTWDGTIVNADNPQRRDVELLPAGGYLVVQWDQNNPGVWPFHCHIAWHLSGGLYANILERPADIANLPITSQTYQTCRNWATWSGSNNVNEIDSGL
ncbi:MAG: hypothetical protein M1827_003525 [Pycnora praestabilis]|nr:MAG: hypothetical protein M1827_003525 [Pycnora praestabilis]